MATESTRAAKMAGPQRAAKRFGPVTLAYVYHPMHVLAVTR